MIKSLIYGKCLDKMRLTLFGETFQCASKINALKNYAQNLVMKLRKRVSIYFGLMQQIIILEPDEK